MDFHLTGEYEELIESKLRSGQYGSADEVVREALRLLQERDEVFASRVQQIREQVEQGWQDAQHSRLVDGDEVFDRLDRQIGASKRSSKE